ncbi:hypothetical protein [Niabella ginsengisoli]|uniref:Uncharacterized protein n=1 Tax=Niabella ginsengisoli TaxID=522298 RepID=A0ABS9SLU4_9BACT|nr:hypothetical protein [Niabella ginsengisoli]MCH5599348.1 hypothetical protein [Niabella ginsengisoli]
MQLLGKSIQIPDAVKPALDFVFSNKKFSLKDLPENTEVTKDLVTKLIREGVVYIDESM